MTLDAVIRQRAEYWATAEVFDEKTRREIATLLEKSDEAELVDRFYKDLEFGTGGLRGILGAGTSRMNVYNVRKATCALARYLRDTHGKTTEVRIAVSYDSRRFSREFAETVVQVMAAHGIKTFITKELRPTPVLSFMVRHFKCQAGVCVTASHNPPNYNGYKVYMPTGGQLVPPMDEEVIKRYGQIQDYSTIPSVSFGEALSKGLAEEVGKDLDEAYFREVERLSLRREGREGFRIVFTPLHGTGYYPVSETLRRYGFEDVIVVPEQKDPDSDFPTVKYPNPEDPAAMEMAIALGRKVKADLILGTDPDCDRLALVVREGDDYLILNGNQIGSLLLEYVLSSAKETGRLPGNAFVVKTIVTTDLQNLIAEHYGVHVDETLTGFKWICQVIEDYEIGVRKPYRQYVCGGEESYGFLAGSFVRDKDGAIGCALSAEMVAWYKSRGLRMSDVLNQLYRRHGVFMETLHNLVLSGRDGAVAIQSMMKRLRTDPPRAIDGVPVDKVRDLLVSQELRFGAKGLEFVGKLSQPRSDVLQFLLEDGTKVSVRPSGTEPKIKFYVSVREAVAGPTDRELDESKARSAQRAKRIEEIFVAMARAVK